MRYILAAVIAALIAAPMPVGAVHHRLRVPVSRNLRKGRAHRKPGRFAVKVRNRQEIVWEVR